ncbi:MULTISPECIES: MarR family winged helix-turn-helix transcriptional regulator [unclassified Cupriavidus]|uniref:MarR family winged helix-turn-helix transcriptional regulator n=1 Tax=unclassified Cupriavidus TaxID=2640874 RepID=UPI0010F9024B|nr:MULTISPECIES: MarR family transcriptional regulator [unclassified Cupriavidus]MWL87027.1 MarR family transcriptional regulator [Cupriavidus sp. SW-Y-13]
MQPKALEIHEPVVMSLVDAVTAWQTALDRTLNVSGLSYPKWLLLRAIRQNEFTRGQPCAGAIFLDVPQTERLLRELHADGWIEFPIDDAPQISPAAKPQIERAARAVRALHSVSVCDLSAAERAALSSLLHRMTGTLDDHAARHARHAAWDHHPMSIVVPDEPAHGSRHALAA